MQVKKWNDKGADQDLTAMYIRANTKKCPLCALEITKDGGCAHMKCRVFNAYLKAVDGRTPPAGAFGLNPAEKKLKFGVCIAEYPQSKGWVHDAVFNPSGTGLAFVGHDTGHNGITHTPQLDSAIGLLVGNALTGIFS